MNTSEGLQIRHASISETLVVAFRTHRWDRDIAVLARRLAYYAQGVTFVVLADETDGALDTGHFRKLAHTQDFSGFGLPGFPAGQVLWWNGDYALYLLRREFPAATHFAMVEYDVEVNTDVAAILRDAQARRIDLIADCLRESSAATWCWHRTVERHFEHPFSAFLPFICISARAIDACRRARNALDPRPQALEDWPIWTGLVATVAAGLAAPVCEDLRHYAQLPHYHADQPAHLNDPEVQQAGSIAHPVLGDEGIRRRLRLEKPEAVLDPGSALRRQLRFCDPVGFAPELYERLRAQGTPELLRRYLALARAQNWPLPQAVAAPGTKPYLVILRAGTGSLHSAWLHGAAAPNFDLVLCPYQDIPLEPGACLQTDPKPGQKWTGIHQLLREWQGWRQYDYIWLPDDDLQTDSTTINRLFELSDAFNTTISAPALTENSYFAHGITMRNANFYARATAFVEIMLPCLRRDVLELVLPSIEMSKTGYGWGLDFVWPRLVHYKNIMIFDCIAVRHTRPVAAIRDPTLIEEGNAEMSRVLARYKAPAQCKTLGAQHEDGRFEPADSQLFLLKYLNGYRYLIERHPGLIDNLLRQQAVQLPPPPALPNLALRRPALISSVWRELLPLDPAVAAAGANDGKPTREAGFHTEFEENPWWQVDLQASCRVERVVVYNRLDFKARCTRLSVSGSADGAAWTVLGAKLDDAVFGGVDGDPYVFEFIPPCKTRFIRLTMLGSGYLHLAEVEVFGQRAEPGEV